MKRSVQTYYTGKRGRLSQLFIDSSYIIYMMVSLHWIIHIYICSNISQQKTARIETSKKSYYTLHLLRIF